MKPLFFHYIVVYLVETTSTPILFFVSLSFMLWIALARLPPIGWLRRTGSLRTLEQRCSFSWTSCSRLPNSGVRLGFVPSKADEDLFGWTPRTETDVHKLYRDTIIADEKQIASEIATRKNKFFLLRQSRHSRSSFGNPISYNACMVDQIHSSL